MTVAAIHETVLLYTAEQANLTYDLGTIMGKITTATRENSTLLTETTNKRDEVSKTYDVDSTEYETKMEEVNDDYQVKLAEINAWEAELEEQKNATETKLKEITSYKESFEQAEKSNIKKDFTYGQSS